MIRRPPGTKRTDTICPSTRLFRSRQRAGASFADLLGAGRGITISIGLAVAPASFSAVFERLYVAADHALYLAKRGGRNRVELASLEDIRRAEIRLAAV